MDSHNLFEGKKTEVDNILQKFLTFNNTYQLYSDAHSKQVLLGLFAIAKKFRIVSAGFLNSCIDIKDFDLLSKVLEHLRSSKTLFRPVDYSRSFCPCISAMSLIKDERNCCDALLSEAISQKIYNDQTPGYVWIKSYADVIMHHQVKMEACEFPIQRKTEEEIIRKRISEMIKSPELSQLMMTEQILSLPFLNAPLFLMIFIEHGLTIDEKNPIFFNLLCHLYKSKEKNSLLLKGLENRFSENVVRLIEIQHDYIPKIAWHEFFSFLKDPHLLSFLQMDLERCSKLIVTVFDEVVAAIDHSFYQSKEHEEL